MPLICGVNDITTHGAADLGVAAHEAGADGILVAAPYYSLPSQSEMADHCLAVDRATGLPIMLYNYPGRTGVSMGREFLTRVTQSGNFQSIKEASGDINRIHLLVTEFPGLDLCCGAEDQALEFFVWGANSWVTPMGNFLAPEVIALYDICTGRKDFDLARKVMAALLPLTGVLEGGGMLLQCTKFACDHFGLPAGHVRPPLGPLPEKAAGELLEVLEKTKRSLAAILAD